MSVRRLADANLQPAAFAFNKGNSVWAKAQIKKYPKGREQSAVIPLMMRAQEQEGWVTKAAIECIADMLEMPRIRALEVATFYTQFQLKPVGTKAHVQVCGTTPCMLRGSEDLMAVCKSKIHHDQFHTNAAGTLSWEEVECLGACVNAPMVMIFNDTYEDLTPKRLEEIIDAFEAGKGASVKPGPQIDRIYSAPITGLTSLNDNNASKAKPSAKKAEEVAIKAQEKPAAVKAAAPAALMAKPKAAPASKAPSPKPANDGKPELLTKPRSGKGDDLKLIWGVGPKLEKMLNAMGVWHFDQIAAWGKSELSWVDERLEGFKGRAARDEWVKQSKKLAKGWRPDSAVGERPV
jgi:NADH-quinone oxidoreductase subunit E